MATLIYGVFYFSTFSMAASGGMTILLYFFFLVQLFINPHYRQLQTLLLFSTLIFILSILAATTVTISFQQTGEQLRESWRFFLPFVIWKAGQTLDLKNLFKWFFVLLIVIAIYGIIQHYWGVDWFRPEGKKQITPYIVGNIETNVFHAKGNFSHHLTYAHYLLLIFPLFFSQIFNSSQPLKNRFMLLAGSGILLTSLFLSLSRSAWLGTCVALSILCLRFPKKWLLRLTGILVSGAILFFIFVQFHTTDRASITEAPIIDRITGIFSVTRNQDRLMMWESARLAIRDHFWWGIGPEQDGSVMPFYRDIVKKEYQYPEFYNKASVGVHNIYLQTWLNFGLIGFLGYLCFWGVILFWLVKALAQTGPGGSFHKDLLWGLLSGFLGFLVAGIFENSFRDGEIQTILFALIGLAILIGESDKEKI